MDLIRDGIERLFWNYRENRLRAPWRLVVTFVAFLLAVLVLAGVGTLLGGAVPTGPLTAVIGELALTVGLILSVVAIVWVVDRRRLHDIGLGWDRVWLRDLLGGMAIGFGMVICIVGVLVATGIGTIEGTAVQSEGDLLAGLSVPAGLVVGLGLFGVLAGLEELLFRGYLLVNIAEGFHGLLGPERSVLLGAGVSSVCFGLVHAANPGGGVLGAVNIILLGGLLAASYALTGRLAVPVGIHTAWNYTLGLVFGVPVSGLTTGVAIVDMELADPALLSGGSFGPEGGLVTLVALVVGAGLLTGWLRQFTNRLSVDGTISVPDIR